MTEQPERSDRTEPTDTAIWVTVTELAKRKGVGKSSVSERVSKLEAAGLIETKPGTGRTKKLINLVSYDRAVGEVGDPAKEAAAVTRAEAPEKAPSRYRDVQADKTHYEAELRKLELAERRGQLVPIVKVQEEMTVFGGAILRVFESLGQRVAEAHAAGLKDGEQGLRRLFKQIVFEQCEAASRAMAAIEQEGKRLEAAGLIQVELPLADGES